MISVNFFLLIGWFAVTGLHSDRAFPKENAIDLRITCQECVGKYVSISTFSMLRNEEKVLYRSRFDDSGITSIKIASQDTLSVLLRVHENEEPGFDVSLWLINSMLYLEPNKWLGLRFEGDSLSTNGELGKVNTYIEQIARVNQERVGFSQAHFDKIRKSSDNQEIETYLSILRSYGEKLNQIIAADQSLDSYYKELLTNRNSSFEVQQNLSLSIDKAQNKNQKTPKLVPNKRNLTTFGIKVFSELSINSYAIKDNDAYYAFLMKQRIRYPIWELLSFYHDNDLEEKISKYEFIKQSIAGNANLVPVQDFLLAICLISDEDGIQYNELLEEVGVFKKDYPSSKYTPDLEDILGEYGELKNGMPLKDFSMQDSTGTEFRLSDLKGKLLYIDIWATWCSPCREEFKYSKKLSQKYGNRNDLVFLYVSKDSRPEDWKKFLRNNPELKGVHGIQPPSDIPFDEHSVMRLYKTNGIPRYILIGKDGRIIDYNATRPSQLVHSDELDSLLKL